MVARGTPVAVMGIPYGVERPLHPSWACCSSASGEAGAALVRVGSRRAALSWNVAETGGLRRGWGLHRRRIVRTRRRCSIVEGAGWARMNTLEALLDIAGDGSAGIYLLCNTEDDWSNQGY